MHTNYPNTAKNTQRERPDYAAALHDDSDADYAGYCDQSDDSDVWYIVYFVH